MFYENVAIGSSRGFATRAVLVQGITSSDWADYDGDGDLDFAVTSGDGYSYVYRRNGGFTFSRVDNPVR
jgi:hypothetical protein